MKMSDLQLLQKYRSTIELRGGARHTSVRNGKFIQQTH